MTAFAINMLALLIVLGLCWGAMMWLSGRFHGQRQASTSSEFEFDTIGIHDDQRTVRRTRLDRDGAHDLPSPMPATPPCAQCEGVGAHSSQGKLTPCPECFGTGVLS